MVLPGAIALPVITEPMTAVPVMAVMPVMPVMLVPGVTGGDALA